MAVELQNRGVMRCPECRIHNEANSSACTGCGLLLVSLETPRRRSEDLRNEARRANDQEETPCVFCNGTIESSAVRCRHCSEIVDPQFRIESVLRHRASINYASWVAYVLGLFALVIFRPIGLIAIGAGLLLSIAYYAIPVDTVEAHRSNSRMGDLLRVLKSRWPLERTPVFTRRRLMFLGSPLLVAFLGFLANFFLLQHPMNEVLRENHAYRGMQISTRYAWWVVPGVVVYDLENVSGSHSRLDVHTVFLEYAKRLKSRNVRKVELRYRGDARFSVDGESFRRLGEEYANRNYAFALFEFPRLVGDREAEGAAVDGREALMQFHDVWYADALLESGGP